MQNENTPAIPPPKLLGQVRDRIRVKHCSTRTETQYVQGTSINCHREEHPKGINSATWRSRNNVDMSRFLDCFASLAMAKIEFIEVPFSGLSASSNEQGFMMRRFARINDLPIAEVDRKFFWPLGRRPDDHPGQPDPGR